MDRRGSHWTKWDKLYHAKMRGRLGFCDFLSFNQVLIAKQRRRIIQHTKSLTSKVLKTRYFKQSNFMEAKLGSNPSFIWKSILYGRHILHRGLKWRIGSGN